MSTQFNLYNRNGLEIELDERSSQFSISITDHNNPLELTSRIADRLWRGTVGTAHASITPEDAIGIALEMLKIASYQIGTGGEFETAVFKHVSNKTDRGYYDEIARRVASGVALQAAARYPSAPAGKDDLP